MSEEMQITLAYNGVHHVSLYDSVDHEIVSSSTWRIHPSCKTRSNGSLYIRRLGDGRFLHRLMLNPPRGMVVDHINGNGLDNRRSNIRVCTQSQNVMHRTRAVERRGTGVVGVRFCPSDQMRPWRASIDVNNSRIELGSFKTFVEAFESRLAAEHEHHSEFRNSVNAQVIERLSRAIVAAGKGMT